MAGALPPPIRSLALFTRHVALVGWRDAILAYLAYAGGAMADLGSVRETTLIEALALADSTPKLLLLVLAANLALARGWPVLRLLPLAALVGAALGDVGLTGAG